MRPNRLAGLQGDATGQAERGGGSGASRGLARSAAEGWLVPATELVRATQVAGVGATTELAEVLDAIRGVAAAAGDPRADCSPPTP
ncbi:MAG: hypothetical protein ACK5LN_07400 [Propioniciclava sp.]